MKTVEDKELDDLITEIKRKREHILIYRDIENNYDKWKIIHQFYSGYNSYMVKDLLDDMPSDVKPVWNRFSLEKKIEILHDNTNIFFSRIKKDHWKNMPFYVDYIVGQKMYYESSVLMKFSKRNK